MFVVLLLYFPDVMRYCACYQNRFDDKKEEFKKMEIGINILFLFLFLFVFPGFGNCDIASIFPFNLQFRNFEKWIVGKLVKKC